MKQKNHIPGLAEKLDDYAQQRLLDIHHYSPYHMRLMDGGFVVLDTWTTGRYYVVMTDYNEMTDGNMTERGGEKGQLPGELWKFLDVLFFGSEFTDIVE